MENWRKRGFAEEGGRGWHEGPKCAFLSSIKREIDLPAIDER